MAIFKGTKYSLTATQLKKLARLCNQEQGSVAGCAAEASLMANLYELYGKKKYSSLSDYVRNGGWFYKAAYYMDNGSCTTAELEAVKDVLVNGNRTVPLYVDEHDCFSDLTSVTNNGKAISKTDRSAYKQHVTKIKNRYGSTYTFYCFPAAYSDPFGYTNNSRAPKNPQPDPDPAPTMYKVGSVTVPQISDGSTGTAVRIWQAIIGCAVDGIFGDYTESRTISWQKSHGLTGDGIVGTKSWQAAFKDLAR